MKKMWYEHGIVWLFLIITTIMVVSSCGGGGGSDSDSDDKDILDGESTNSAPVSDAGSDQNVQAGSLVSLDGSNSSDADGDQLAYRWHITSKPSGSDAEIFNSTAATPTFTADISGEYRLSLVVNDGQSDSEADTVIITANANADIPETFSMIGMLETEKNIKAVVGHDNYIYGLTDDAIIVVDISDPQGPTLIGEVSITSGTNSIDISDNYIITAAGKTNGVNAHISIYDITTPGGITFVDTYNLPSALVGQTCVEYAIDPRLDVCLKYEDNYKDVDQVHNIAVSNGIVYILENIGEFSCMPVITVLDISQPSNIRNLGVNTVQLGGQWNSLENIVIKDNTAYITDNYDELVLIYDISDPENIDMDFSYSGLADSAHPDLDVSDELIFLVEDSHMRIFDTNSDRYDFFSSYTFQTVSDGQRKIKVIGSYAYTISENGLEIVSVYDPYNPVPVDVSTDMDDAFTDILVVGEYLVCSGTKGLYLLNPLTADATLSVDTDNDGVTDDMDSCPGTALGEIVDENGCPASDDDTTWIAVSTGKNHTVSIKSDGTLYGWGDNGSGQLGRRGEIFTTTVPQRITPRYDREWAYIATGSYSTLGIKTDGTLYAWGSSFGYSGYTQQVGSDSDWAMAVVNKNNALFVVGIKTDGSLYAWGSNACGQLGDGTTGEKSSPTRIGSDNDWKMVSVGSLHTVAIKTDGTLYAWGGNSAGQLGNGTTDSHTSPGQIGSDMNWSYVSANEAYTLAIQSDGTLWGWGNNTYGQLGNGTTANSVIPTRIGTDADWTFVSAGCYHCVGIKKDGSLYAWGSNTDGQLGDGTVISKTSPTRIGPETDWAFASAGENYTMGLKTDGTLLAWGDKYGGKLGIGIVDNLVTRPVIVRTDK